MRKGIILWMLMAMAALNAQAQQDAQFTQYIFNGLYINPAYAGYKDDVYIQSYFRSQWVGLTGAPRTFAVAIDGTMNGHVGLGAMLSNDQIGAQSAVSGYINYAYRIRIGQDETSHLAFGLAAGMMQLGIDGSKLNAVTPGDQAVPVAQQSMVLPDANFGMYYANSRYFAGLSVTNFLARYIHNSNETNLLVPIPQPHAYLTAGTLIPVNEDLMIKPVVLVKDDFKGPTTIDLDGFIMMNARLSLGAFYRTSVKLYQKNLQNALPNQNSFGFIAEFFATPAMRIGYSYDHSLNSLSSYTYGSHELSVGIYLKNRNRYDSSSAYRCYKF